MQTAPPLPQQQLAAARGRTKSCREGGSRAARPPPRRASSLFPDAVSQSRDMQSQTPPPLPGGCPCPGTHQHDRPERPGRMRAACRGSRCRTHGAFGTHLTHTHARVSTHADTRHDSQPAAVRGWRVSACCESWRVAPRLAACCGARVARIGLLRVVARIGWRVSACCESWRVSACVLTRAWYVRRSGLMLRRRAGSKLAPPRVAPTPDLTGWSSPCPATKGRGWRERRRCPPRWRSPRAAATRGSLVPRRACQDSRAEE